jgi:hypothetical protein
MYWATFWAIFFTNSSGHLGRKAEMPELKTRVYWLRRFLLLHVEVRNVERQNVETQMASIKMSTDIASDRPPHRLGGIQIVSG